MEQFITHEREPPVSMDISRHSKNSKALFQASDDIWSADILARKYKREATIFINYIEKVTVPVIRFQWSLKSIFRCLNG